MQLKFIWIEEYGLLQNLGINFNQKSLDVFDYNGRELNVTHRKSNILDFGKNVNGITAIAGQNGSGKSSLCHVVLHSTATYTDGLFGFNMKFKGIVCYDDHIFIHEDLVVENQDQLKKLGYTLKKYQDSPLEQLDFEKKYEFTSEGFIYYSNLFDFTSSFDGVNLKNISSTNLLHEDQRTTTAYFRTRERYPHLNSLPKDHKSEISIHNLAEGYRQIRYYLQNFETIPFEGPNLIIVRSAYSYNNRWLRFSDEVDYNEYDHYNEIEKEIFKTFYPYSSVDQSDYEKKTEIHSLTIKLAIEKLYRLNLLRARAALSNEFLPYSKVYDFVNDRILPEIEGADFNQIRIVSELHLELCNMATVMDDTTFQPYYIYSSNSETVEDWRFLLAEYMYIPNTKSGRETLLAFINAEHLCLNGEDVGYIRRITNYQFPTFFSSGESAFLSLFSRLQNTIDLYRDMHFQKNSLIIFIDEGDAGFHPKWNKLYLKWILDFLNTQPEPLKFQLIFSTHSPYLLSDLAPENILLLKRGPSNSTEIVPQDNFESFGANIHELLSNNFFLDDGTIGEFAKIQINKVIDNLLSWKELKQSSGKDALINISNEHRQYSLQLINTIGDYIVRGKLMEMYLEIFEDELATQQEINYLENRIKNLKRK